MEIKSYFSVDYSSIILFRDNNTIILVILSPSHRHRKKILMIDLFASLSIFNIYEVWCKTQRQKLDDGIVKYFKIRRTPVKDESGLYYSLAGVSGGVYVSGG